MSDDLSSQSCCVIDDGQFVELAIRLAREFGKVYYFNPTLIEGFPTVSKWSIGKGFQEIEWIEQLWPVKDKIDLFVFGDIMNSGLQHELESQGKRVIGSRTGDELEIHRIAFKKIQKRLGLNVPKHVVIEGLDELRRHLQTVEDKWIKISRFRGTFETEHHINYELSKNWINKLACELGPLAEDMLFLVEDPIRGEVEFGYDGFCFNGKFPDKTLFGPEIKSKSYIGSVMDYQDMDERLRAVNEALAPELAKAGYRNFFSTEVRIAKDDENFEDGEPVLIEPTCRTPSPPFEAELEMYENLGAILWHGAVGEVIQPVMADNFSVICRLTHDDSPEGWRSLQIDPKVRQWVKLYDAVKRDDAYHIAPKAPHARRIGAVVGNGGTIEEAINVCHEYLELLKDQPVGNEFESLADALKEIQAAKKQDVEFTDQKIPEPAIIVEA